MGVSLTSRSNYASNNKVIKLHWLSLLWGSLLPSPGSWCQQGFACVLQEPLFPQAYKSSLIKSCWPSKSGSLGIPSPFARSPCVMEKTLESPLKSKEFEPVNPKGNQSWIFIRRTDAETETPILWPPDEESQLIRKDPVAGKDPRREEKGTTEDEMLGWHHWFNGHEFEQAPGDGEGQGSLACCSPRGRKESDTTEWFNNNNNTLASLVWGLEPSQQCENFFGMIVVQSVGHPPSSCV